MSQKGCTKYIVGSDQVWTSPNKRNVLDNGSDIIRISYAASADWTVLNRNEGSRYYMSEVLPLFKNVSVREEEGVRVLRAIRPDIGVTQTIDPTLLLTRADYESIISSKKIFSTPTLFCYFVNVRDSEYLNIEELEKFASEENFSLCMSGIQGAQKFIPRKYYRRLSPEDWLRAYRDASFVLTNSFHGTVFALIFNKEFAVIKQKEQKGRKQNLRLSELTEFCNCSDRLVASDSVSKLHDVLNKEIKWVDINKKISQFSSFSKKWLLDSLADK